MTEPAPQPVAPKSPKLPRGSRNLILLGVIAIFIAGLTTGISILIYHYSGDMYLDSSRPGHLPEKKETEDEDDEETKYTVKDTGPLDAKTIDEFIYYYNDQLDRIKAIETPYSADPLSDESLGIPVELENQSNMD